MKIGLDFDGVIGNYAGLKEVAAMRYHGIQIRGGHIRRDEVVGGGLLSDGEYTALINRVCEHEDPGLLMKPVVDALFYIEKLQEDHQIEVVTARTDNGVSIAKEWLVRNNISLPITGVGLSGDKRDATRHLDLFVDDSPQVLFPLIGQVATLFLFSWPYNEDEHIPETIARVKSWKELYDEIQKL